MQDSKQQRQQISKAAMKDRLLAYLKQVNQNLPANVYVPFVSQSVRNYAVLHIPPAESRLI